VEYYENTFQYNTFGPTNGWEYFPKDELTIDKYRWLQMNSLVA